MTEKRIDKLKDVIKYGICEEVSREINNIIDYLSSLNGRYEKIELNNITRRITDKKYVQIK